MFYLVPWHTLSRVVQYDGAHTKHTQAQHSVLWRATGWASTVVIMNMKLTVQAVAELFRIAPVFFERKVEHGVVGISGHLLYDVDELRQAFV